MAHRQQQQPLVDKTYVYREASVEASLLDAMVEAGVISQPKAPAVAVGGIDLAEVSAPTTGYSRGRKLIVRDVQVVAQDSDVLCQGGLFGAVEPSAAAHHGHMAAVQAGLFTGATVDVRTSGAVCICGDGSCDIGPFVER